MDRYPRPPRAPFTGMSLGDYVWWGFLVFFRLWLLCQITTGLGAFIYWWLPHDVSEFLFRNYITLWTVYLAPLFPDQLWLTPMWYERPEWPVIGLILALRSMELFRRASLFQNITPSAFRGFVRKPEASRPFRSGGQHAKHDEAYGYDPARFSAGARQQSQRDSSHLWPLRIENKLVQRAGQTPGDAHGHDEPKDAKTIKAEQLLRDPRISPHVRDAAQRLLDRRKNRKS